MRAANPGMPHAPPGMRVHRSLRLWNLLVDLEETLGSLESTKAAYYRMMDQRIATPQTILNFALLLQEHKYFEEAFRCVLAATFSLAPLLCSHHVVPLRHPAALLSLTSPISSSSYRSPPPTHLIAFLPLPTRRVYERGTQMFKFPYSKDIWAAYLQQFVSRYGGSRLERARDLFEQVVESAPADEAKQFYLMYADLEEQHGLARRAMAVYDKAVRKLPKKDKMAVLDLYISKASSMFGIGRVREVMEMAIEVEVSAGPLRWRMHIPTTRGNGVPGTIARALSPCLLDSVHLPQHCPTPALFRTAPLDIPCLPDPRTLCPQSSPRRAQRAFPTTTAGRFVSATPRSRPS